MGRSAPLLATARLVHPAYSVIFFTTASGTGYGMLGVAAALALAGRLPLDGWFAWPLFVTAFGLVTAGLLSSLLHLGHPERFLKALTQWRSSWLSREGVLALATYVPSGLFALGWLFVVETPGSIGAVMAILAVLTIVLCLVTVHATSMIYASLKPIPQWHRGDVPLVYLSLGFSAGALAVHALAALNGSASGLTAGIALAAVILATLAKHRYWRGIRQLNPTTTAASAIAMAQGTTVRALDPPHTAPNYLQKEMGFRVARKHADKLRRLAYGFAFGLPLGATLLTLWTPEALTAVLATVAALSALLGTAIERWLFFAEATHTVTLYYGADAV